MFRYRVDEGLWYFSQVVVAQIKGRQRRVAQQAGGPLVDPRAMQVQACQLGHRTEIGGFFQWGLGQIDDLQPAQRTQFCSTGFIQLKAVRTQIQVNQFVHITYAGRQFAKTGVIDGERFQLGEIGEECLASIRPMDGLKVQRPDMAEVRRQCRQWSTAGRYPEDCARLLQPAGLDDSGQTSRRPEVNGATFHIYRYTVVIIGHMIFKLRFKQLELLQASGQCFITQMQNIIPGGLGILVRVHPLHHRQFGNVFGQPQTLRMSGAGQCRMIRGEAAPVQFQGFPIAGRKVVALDEGDAVESDGGFELRGGGIEQCLRYFLQSVIAQVDDVQTRQVAQSCRPLIQLRIAQVQRFQTGQCAEIGRDTQRIVREVDGFNIAECGKCRCVWCVQQNPVCTQIQRSQVAHLRQGNRQSVQRGACDRQLLQAREAGEKRVGCGRPGHRVQSQVADMAEISLQRGQGAAARCKPQRCAGLAAKAAFYFEGDLFCPVFCCAWRRGRRVAPERQLVLERFVFCFASTQPAFDVAAQRAQVCVNLFLAHGGVQPFCASVRTAQSIDDGGNPVCQSSLNRPRMFCAGPRQSTCNRFGRCRRGWSGGILWMPEPAFGVTQQYRAEGLQIG